MLTIKGIYGREMFETWYAMSVLLESGLDISGVITDRFPTADFEAAFAAARPGHGGKVIMTWGGLERMYDRTAGPAAGDLAQLRAEGLYKAEARDHHPAGGRDRGRRARRC